MVKKILWITVLLLCLNLASAVEFWNESKWIRISYDGTNSTDHEVLIHIDSTNFTAINWSTNGTDLKFEQDGNDLDYYIESWNETLQNATVWVEIPNLTGSANGTLGYNYIEMQFGGGEHVGTRSNANNTFDMIEYGWGDDDTNLTVGDWIRGWQVTDGNSSYTNDYNYEYDYHKNNSLVLKVGKYENLLDFSSYISTPLNYTFETRLYITTALNSDLFFGLSNGSDDQMRSDFFAIGLSGAIGDANVGHFISNTWTDSGVNSDNLNWFPVKFAINDSGDISFYFDNALFATETGTLVNDTLTHIGIGTEGVTSRDSVFDNIMIRNYELSRPVQTNDAGQLIINLTNSEGTYLSVFNVTINENFSSTTNGTIFTELNNRSTENLLIESPGYFNLNTLVSVFGEQTFSLDTSLLTFNAKGYLDEMMDLPSWIFHNLSLTVSGNPYLANGTLFVPNNNQSNQSFLLSDEQSFYIPENFTVWINSTNQTEYNFTLDPNQLTFLFWQNGSAWDSTGWIVDSELNTFGFNNTTMVVVHQNLSLGRVNMRFGLLDGENHTQYYEYINDYEDNFTENLEILSIGDWVSYVRVLDNSNDPIPNAIVRMEMAYHTNATWTEGTLIGQRLADDDGYIFFIADSSTDILLRVSADGYSTNTYLITIGDESWTKDNPIIVNLVPSTSFNPAFVDFNYPTRVNNFSEDIPFKVTAYRTLVEITTDYRSSLGLDWKTCTVNVYNVWDCDLETGTDFDTSNTTKQIWIAIDSENYTGRTVSLYVIESDAFGTNTGLPEVPNVMLGVVIVLVTAFVSSISKNMGAGVVAFTVMVIIASFFNPQFLWLTLVMILYMGGRIATSANRT